MSQNSTNSTFLALLVFLFLKAIFVIIVIMYAGIHLGPDEAQYWTWSQNLDWGYYSKPPGIAWQIRLGTLLFGNTELGVRFGSLIIGTLIPIIIYFTALEAKLNQNIAFWSAMVMAFSPLGMMATLLAITDVGMILFWTLALWIIVKSISTNKIPNYPLIGFCILCGALFKWPIYLLWIFIVGLNFFYPSSRSWKLFLGICISLVGLLPSIYWNSTHDWVTFKHVFYTVKVPETHAVTNHGNFFEFFGAQVALLSPILFVLLLISFFYLFKNWQKITPSLKFLALVCLICLLIGTSFSIFKKIQGNWFLFAYPSGIIYLTWYSYEKVLKWLKAGLVLSILLCAFLLMIPTLEKMGVNIPYRMNPFKHNVGWENLTVFLKYSGYKPNENFLFSDKYQMTSLLSFYSQNQKRAYFLNLQGIRKNQFCFWPSMADEQKGKTGYFVLTENEPFLSRNKEKLIRSYQESLKEYFAKVEFLGEKPLFITDKKVVKGAFIFKCENYNGSIPFCKNLY